MAGPLSTVQQHSQTGPIDPLAGVREGERPSLVGQWMWGWSGGIYPVTQAVGFLDGQSVFKQLTTTTKVANASLSKSQRILGRCWLRWIVTLQRWWYLPLATIDWSVPSRQCVLPKHCFISFSRQPNYLMGGGTKTPVLLTLTTGQCSLLTRIKILLSPNTLLPKIYFYERFYFK